MSREGIELPDSIKAIRLACIKRTPGPYGRMHIANVPHRNAWTWIHEKGWANGEAIALWHEGQMYFRETLKSGQSVMEHPELNRWLKKCVEFGATC